MGLLILTLVCYIALVGQNPTCLQIIIKLVHKALVIIFLFLESIKAKYITINWVLLLETYM